MFSTLGDTMMSVGDIMSTLGDVQYTGGCSVHWGMFSTLGDVQYTGGCSVHWSFHTNSIVFPMTFPTFIMISPQCTHDVPHCTSHPQCTAQTFCSVLTEFHVRKCCRTCHSINLSMHKKVHARWIGVWLNFVPHLINI